MLQWLREMVRHEHREERRKIADADTARTIRAIDKTDRAVRELDTNMIRLRLQLIERRKKERDQ
jgi:hypothetical protein